MSGSFPPRNDLSDRLCGDEISTVNELQLLTRSATVLFEEAKDRSATVFRKWLKNSSQGVIRADIWERNSASSVNRTP